jgi:hypothetical protein
MRHGAAYHVLPARRLDFPKGIFDGFGKKYTNEPFYILAFPFLLETQSLEAF